MHFLAEIGSFYATLFITLGSFVAMGLAGVKVVDLAKKHGANFWIVVFLAFIGLFILVNVISPSPHEFPDDSEIPHYVR